MTCEKAKFSESMQSWSKIKLGLHGSMKLIFFYFLVVCEIELRMQHFGHLSASKFLSRYVHRDGGKQASSRTNILMMNLCDGKGVSLD